MKPTAILFSIVLLSQSLAALVASERQPVAAFSSFEEALLSAIIEKVQLYLILKIQPEVVDERPSYMSPRIDAIYLVMGQKSRMTVTLISPPHPFAKDGRPTVFINPFDDLRYFIQVDSATILGQRLLQFLQLAKVNTDNKSIVGQISGALSTGPKEKLSVIVDQINAEDRVKIEEFWRKR